jgi:N-[(2S)-2-amino-2-carboxyethyl]-L-glutamate dehydrogenase
MATFRYLDRADVRTCLDGIDLLEVIAEVLRGHAQGRSALPTEGYLPWTNSSGDYTRAIAMLGAVPSRQGMAYGMKLINASVGNPRRGIERAGGLSFLFDPETARPLVMAEAALMSAMRTAGYTMLSARHIGPDHWSRFGLIGCGTLARAHIDLLAQVFPDVSHVHFFDADPGAAIAFDAWLQRSHPELSRHRADSAQDVAAAADVLVTLTTSDAPYLPASSLSPGTLVAHVSLDDLTADAFLRAQAVYVDDAQLVRDNPRRVLGRLMQDGAVREPSTTAGDGDRHAGRALDGTLGDVLLGRCEPRRPASGFVVSNPFGMAILDVGLLDAVATEAVQRDLGQRLVLQ